MGRVSEKEVLAVIKKLQTEIDNTPTGKNTQRLELAKEIIADLNNTIIYTESKNVPTEKPVKKKTTTKKKK